jgi:Tol biopolymer transport system component
MHIASPETAQARSDHAPSRRKVTAAGMVAIGAASALLLIDNTGTIASPPQAHVAPDAGPEAPEGLDYLAFVSDANGSNQIMVLETASGEVREVTDADSNAWNPQLSPDGTHIVYASDKTGDSEVYELALDDLGTPIQLTNNPGFRDDDPTYSSDGTSIYYKVQTDDDEGDIWRMDAGTGEHQQAVASLPGEQWKPDEFGGVLVFTTRSGTDATSDDIYALPTGLDTPMALTGRDMIAAQPVSDWYPDISPDGTRIAFVSRESPDSPEGVYTMARDGLDRQRLTPEGTECADPSWTRDGKWLLTICRDGDNPYDMYVVDTANGELQQLLEDPAGSASRELSPIQLPSVRVG